MKFDHAVNHNGVYYEAGEEVPIKEEQKAVEQTAALPKVERDEPVDEPVEFHEQVSEIPQTHRRGRQRRKG